MLIKDDWLNRSHGILNLATDKTYLYIEHLFALVNHELSQDKSDCNTGRWREYLCIDHLSTSIKNWSSIYHYDVWLRYEQRASPACQVAKDISHIPVSLSLLQGASVSVHVRSSPPLPLHSGSFNISCATCVKAQGRGLDMNVVKWPQGHKCSCSKLIEKLTSLLQY